MAYKYRDSVLVVEGFYEGSSGQVVEELDYEGTDISKLGTKEYKVKVTSYIVVNENELALLKENKKDQK